MSVPHHTHRQFKDLAGSRFGKLTAISPLRENGRVKWMCQCDCGETAAILAYNLTRGLSKSCGCARDAAAAQRMSDRATHRMCNSRTYTSWAAMRKRCTNPDAPNFKWYGGCGIYICKRWDSFENFLADMGVRPPGMTLDRINPEGIYEPSNCRWASDYDQANNRRNKIAVTHGGRTQPISAWAAELGMNEKTLRHRLWRGMQIDEAFIPPTPRRRTTAAVALHPGYSS